MALLNKQKNKNKNYYCSFPFFYKLITETEIKLRQEIRGDFDARRKEQSSCPEARRGFAEDQEVNAMEGGRRTPHKAPGVARRGFRRNTGRGKTQTNKSVCVCVREMHPQ